MRVLGISCLVMLSVLPSACGGGGNNSETNATGGISTNGTSATGGSVVGGASSSGVTTAAGGNTNISGSTGGTTNTSGTASTGGTSPTNSTVGTDCSGKLEEIQTSSGLCVAKMVTIPGPGDAGGTNYKIDATEVTRGQYAGWLATNPALPPSTDANCGWNTSYTPPSTCNASASSCQTDCGHLPQECVDWCDAFAYCAGVGKRLCGAISGGSNIYASFADPSLSQWHRACSSGGKYLGTYGNTTDNTKCNEYAYWAPNYDNARTLPVGSLTGCQSPLPDYAGAYDLNGNVWEWEDSCDAAGQTGNCRIRGLGFYYYAEISGCAADTSSFRFQGGGGLGIRCCSL